MYPARYLLSQSMDFVQDCPLIIYPPEVMKKRSASIFILLRWIMIQIFTVKRLKRNWYKNRAYNIQ